MSGIYARWRPILEVRSSLAAHASSEEGQPVAHFGSNRRVSSLSAAAAFCSRSASGLPFQPQATADSNPARVFGQFIIDDLYAIPQS